MEVMIDGYGQKKYYIGGETLSESEMLYIYNNYCDAHECYGEMIYDNDDEFFATFSTRRELLEETCNNTDYDINDEYVTYERELYLKSGCLEDCMDEDYLEEIEKKLENDGDDD